VKGVLDTSVFIAGEQGRPLDEDLLPDEAAVSVITLAELELGVHLATTGGVRAQRIATLVAVQSTYVPLPVDGAVASAFAEIVAAARVAGAKARVQNAWIAATAKAHGVAVYTQDADFDGLGVTVVTV
jgi:predicted nucleic acid-binding protein